MLAHWCYCNHFFFLLHIYKDEWNYVDGLVQYCSISISNALKILQSCMTLTLWFLFKYLVICSDRQVFPSYLIVPWLLFLGHCLKACTIRTHLPSLTKLFSHFSYTVVRKLSSHSGTLLLTKQEESWPAQKTVHSDDGMILSIFPKILNL